MTDDLATDRERATRTRNRWLAVAIAAVVLVLVARQEMRVDDLEKRLVAATTAIHILNVSAREHEFVVCNEEPVSVAGVYYDHACRPLLTFEQSERLKDWLARQG